MKRYTILFLMVAVMAPALLQSADERSWLSRVKGNYMSPERLAQWEEGEQRRSARLERAAARIKEGASEVVRGLRAGARGLVSATEEAAILREIAPEFEGTWASDIAAKRAARRERAARYEAAYNPRYGSSGAKRKMERLGAYNTLPASPLNEQFLYNPEPTEEQTAMYELMKPGAVLRPESRGWGELASGFARRTGETLSYPFGQGYEAYKGGKRRIFGTPRASEYSKLYASEQAQPMVAPAPSEMPAVPAKSFWERLGSYVPTRTSNEGYPVTNAFRPGPYVTGSLENREFPVVTPRGPAFPRTTTGYGVPSGFETEGGFGNVDVMRPYQPETQSWGQYLRSKVPNVSMPKFSMPSMPQFSYGKRKNVEPMMP